MQTTQGLSSLLWFIAIVVMIPVALWLLKRTPLGSGRAFGVPAAGAPRTVATLSLSPHQRIVTVEVGQGEQRQWLVLGVTAQNISTLHSLPPQSEPAAADAPAPAFSQLLGRLWGEPKPMPHAQPPGQAEGHR